MVSGVTWGHFYWFKRNSQIQPRRKVTDRGCGPEVKFFKRIILLFNIAFTQQYRVNIAFSDSLCFMLKSSQIFFNFFFLLTVVKIYQYIIVRGLHLIPIHTIEIEEV